MKMTRHNQRHVHLPASALSIIVAAMLSGCYEQPTVAPDSFGPATDGQTYEFDIHMLAEFAGRFFAQPNTNNTIHILQYKMQDGNEQFAIVNAPVTKVYPIDSEAFTNWFQSAVTASGTSCTVDTTKSIENDALGIFKNLMLSQTCTHYDISQKDGESKTDSGTDGGSEPDSGTDGGTEPDSGTDGGTEPDSGTDGGTEPDSGTDGGTETGSGEDSEKKDNPNSENNNTNAPWYRCQNNPGLSENLKSICENVTHAYELTFDYYSSGSEQIQIVWNSANTFDSKSDSNSDSKPGTGTLQSIRVASGDSIGVSPLQSSILDDIPTVAVLNNLNLTADTFGNHSFDFNLSYLKKIIQYADYHYVAANLTSVPQNLNYYSAADPSKNKRVSPYLIAKISHDAPEGESDSSHNPLYLAIVGVTDKNVRASVFPGRFGSLGFAQDYCPMIQAMEDAYNKGARAFFIIGHIYSDFDNIRDILNAITLLTLPSYSDTTAQSCPTRLRLSNDHVNDYCKENNGDCKNKMIAEMRHEIYDGIIGIFGEATSTTPRLIPINVPKNTADYAACMNALGNDSAQCSCGRILNTDGKIQEPVLKYYTDGCRSATAQTSQKDADSSGNEKYVSDYVFQDGINMITRQNVTNSAFAALTFESASFYDMNLKLSDLSYLPKDTKPSGEKKDGGTNGDDEKENSEFEGSTFWYIQIPANGTHVATGKATVKRRASSVIKNAPGYSASLTNYQIHPVISPKFNEAQESGENGNSCAKIFTDIKKQATFCAPLVVSNNDNDKSEYLPIDKLTNPENAKCLDYLMSLSTPEYAPKLWTCVYNRSERILNVDTQTYSPKPLFTLSQCNQEGACDETKNDYRTGSSFVINLALDSIYSFFNNEVRKGNDVNKKEYLVYTNAGVARDSGGRTDWISREWLTSIFPYGNTMVYAKLTGQEIVNLFNFGLKKQSDGGFASSSGFITSYNNNREVCEIWTTVHYDDEILNDDQLHSDKKQLPESYPLTPVTLIYYNTAKQCNGFHFTDFDSVTQKLKSSNKCFNFNVDFDLSPDKTNDYITQTPDNKNTDNTDSDSKELAYVYRKTLNVILPDFLIRGGDGYVDVFGSGKGISALSGSSSKKFDEIVYLYLSAVTGKPKENIATTTDHLIKRHCVNRLYTSQPANDDVPHNQNGKNKYIHNEICSAFTAENPECIN